MSINNPKKGIKDLLKDIYKKWTGFDIEKYSRPAQFIFFIFIGIYGIYHFFSKVDGSINFNNTKQTASVIAANNSGSQVNIGGNNNNVNVNMGDPAEPQQTKINFSVGEWTNAFGDLAELRRNNNIIILPSGEMSGLLKYNLPIQPNSKFEIHFKPLGNKVINFVISVPSIYELIIGDGDYKSVTLKKGSGPDSSLNQYVPMINDSNPSDTSITRPVFNYNIKRGEEIAVNVDQKILANGHLWLQLDIHYWSKESSEKLLQTFKYEFKPSPSIEDSLFLQIGLIGDGSYGQDVSAELINPILSN